MRRLLVRILILLPALLAAAGCSTALDLEQARRFDAANQAYLRGEYAQAAEGFSSLLEEGIESGAILYDLGNSSFRAGRRAEAVAAYRRALRYRPTDPYLLSNLANALSERETEDRALIDHLLFWQRWLSWPGKWRLLLGAATVVFLLGLGAGVRPRLRPFALAGLAIVLLCALSVALAWQEIEGTVHGVVRTDSLVARKGNAPSFEAAFTQPLREGTEFTVLEQRGDWIRIRLRNDPDLEGWIPTRSAVLY